MFFISIKVTLPFEIFSTVYETDFLDSMTESDLETCNAESQTT